jgi:hypothetical protein
LYSACDKSGGIACCCCCGGGGGGGGGGCGCACGGDVESTAAGFGFW